MRRLGGPAAFKAELGRCSAVGSAQRLALERGEQREVISLSGL